MELTQALGEGHGDPACDFGSSRAKREGCVALPGAYSSFRALLRIFVSPRAWREGCIVLPGAHSSSRA